jgi:hypothetical protein
MRKRFQQIISESGYLGLLKRVFCRAERECHQMRQLARAKWSGTYHKTRSSWNLASLIYPKSEELACLNNTIPAQIITHYLNHQFDLLGSGWVEICYGMNCRGLEHYRFAMGKPVSTDAKGNWLKERINPSNLQTAQKIWQHISPDYQPIDWQLDFKSGYRWSERQWSKKIRFGHQPGVDIKVPWELARMQHLPQLALASLAPDCSESLKTRIQDEFQNQVLDFIATNPPGFGVNWVCPMDVAIRAVNWLVARDLLLSSQVQLKPQIEDILAKSIYEHGKYIVANFEWSPLRANHYLADITGLVFIAAYLPTTTEIDNWLAFAVQELIKEVDRQFHPDGGNFEGSTSYHRLSAEMVYYATALILGLSAERLAKLQTYNHKLFKNKRTTPCLKAAPLPFYPLPGGIKLSPFPTEYFQRLERMAEFIIDITKPSGHIPQIGDNDSGRFLKLAPIYQKMTVIDARETYFNLASYSHPEANASTLNLDPAVKPREVDTRLSPPHGTTRLSTPPPTSRGLTAGSTQVTSNSPGDAIYFMENHLDCRHLVAAGSGLFKRPDFAHWLGKEGEASFVADNLIIRTLSKARLRSQQDESHTSEFLHDVGNLATFEELILKIKALPEQHCRQFEFTVNEGDLLTGLTRHAYPNFGLFIFKSPRFYLAIRCWIDNEPLHSSHRHHDQLSIELTIDNKDLISDPGTYLYTPIPIHRCSYRESACHFSPFLSTGNSDVHLENVFKPIQPEKVKVIYWGNKGFIAETIDGEASCQLAVSFGNQSLIVYHANAMKNKFDTKQTLLNSPGYGMKFKHGGNYPSYR